jgi:hypothetical protein
VVKRRPPGVSQEHAVSAEGLATGCQVRNPGGAGCFLSSHSCGEYQERSSLKLEPHNTTAQARTLRCLGAGPLWMSENRKQVT